MNIVTSAVFDLHHSASYFLYTLKVHEKKLSREEKMMADAQVVYFTYAGSDVLG